MDDNCGTCRHFHHDNWWTTHESKEECADAEKEKIGECHRHAPQIVVVQERVIRGAFPETRETNWCGEHQPR